MQDEDQQRICREMKPSKILLSPTHNVQGAAYHSQDQSCTCRKSKNIFLATYQDKKYIYTETE